MTITDSSFIPITPILDDEEIYQPKEPKRSMDTISIPDFKRRLETLESRFSVTSSSLAGSHVDVLPNLQPFTCWVTSPVNQKSWVNKIVVGLTTFEELFYDVMNMIFPSITSFSPFDYYFLWVRPDSIIRLSMGEFVRNYQEIPRFILRHKHHGIQNAVVRDYVSVETIDTSFIHREIEDLFSLSNIALLSEQNLLEQSITSSLDDNGISLNRILSSEDQVMYFRLPYTGNSINCLLYSDD